MLDFFLSTVTDGSMKSLHDGDIPMVNANRTAFLENLGIAPDDTTLVRLTYDRTDFCTYATLSTSDKGDGIARPSSITADALVVTRPGHALFLPLADCIGAVIHDAARGIMMLSHLGRHNLEQYGGRKCVEYLIDTHGCDPADLTVWLSPAAGKDSYPLYSFDNRNLHDVATEQLLSAGIRRENVTVSPIDSAADETYFSHSRYLKGDRPTDGRHAVVAVMR